MLYTQVELALMKANIRHTMNTNIVLGLGETILCDTVFLDTLHYAFTKTH